MAGRSKNWIAEALSEEQQNCIFGDDRKRSILAPAGSGKTRTLTYSIANIIAEGTSPSAIVAFTFTNKAASELLTRVHAVCADHMPEVSLDGLFVGTIHSWCFEFLQQQSEFYNITPLDELHTDALVSRLYDELKLEQTYGVKFPRAIKPFLDDLELFYNEHLDEEDLPPAISESVLQFLRVLRQNRLITFGGMISEAIKFLKANGPLDTLKALFIDEYQDVNPAQVRLIKAILNYDARLTTVGDDLQCIYNWRGSDVSRIIDFPKEFPKASIYRLKENYRSLPQLIDFANKGGERVVFKVPDKAMKPVRKVDHCATPIAWLSVDNDEIQAKSIADIVEKFAGTGVRWGSIAILIRSVISAGPPIVNELTNRGIPVNCPILNRAGSFIEGFIIPLFSWLSEEHSEPRNEEEEREMEAKADALWEATKPWCTEDLDEGTFWAALDTWITSVGKGTDAAYDIRLNLYEFFDRCGVKAAPDDPDLQVGLGISSQIIRSIEEIHRRRLENINRKTARGMVKEALFALRRYQTTFGESIEIMTGLDRVTVTTVHQSKGLEWPIVIIPMLNKNRFPTRRSYHGTSFPDEVAGRYGTDFDDERRLFYVAITRARDRLVLLDSMQQQSNRRSIFLTEMRDCGEQSPATLWSLPKNFFLLEIGAEKLADPPPIKISVADLLLYIACPYQYGLRRQVGIQPAIGAELGYGEGLHELIQRRLEANETWSQDEIRANADKYVFLPYMSSDAEEKAKSVIARNVGALQDIGAFDRSIAAEVPISLILSGGLVTGVIDGVEKLPNGNARITDWKANIHDDLAERYEKQLQLYSFALERQGISVDSAGLVDVAASAKSGSLRVHSIATDKKSVDQMIENVSGAIVDIQENKFEPSCRVVACRVCDVARVCDVRNTDD